MNGDETTLRRALGIALDAIGHAQRTGYPFQNQLAEALPLIQAEYLAQGGFDGEYAVGHGLQRCDKCKRVNCQH